MTGRFYVLLILLYDAYVIADDGNEIRLYKISTNFPSIQEIDGKELEDPYEDFRLTKGIV